MSAPDTPGTPDRAAPHVVMLVGNDITVDTRVKKTAVSLRRLGYRVTVVGYGASGRETATLAGCDIVRVPIPWTHKDAGRTVTAEEIATAGLSPDERIGSDLQSVVVRRLQRAKNPVIAWGNRPSRTKPTALGRKVAKVAALQTMKATARAAVRVLPDPEESELEPATDPVLPWRRAVPIGIDYTEALLPEILALEPDVIHAHDVHTIGAAHQAATRLRAQGREVRWLYDAHEFIAGLSLYGRRDAVERAGWLDMEHEFAPEADAIITVSPALADELSARFPQVRSVHVVLNAPWDAGSVPAPEDGGVRARVGLAPDVPLLVYSGVVTDARGVRTAVEAMPHLPGVHLAVVSTTIGARITGTLRALAERLGAGDRVHFLTPVPAGDVVAHISTADVGLIPILRFRSHDVALTNKLFEYIHAGVPVVVSDCPAQRTFVRHEDIGAVHITGDPVDFALAVGEVLRRLDDYRARVRDPGLRARFSWQGSERALAEVYEGLLGEGACSGPVPAGGYPELVEDAR